MPTPKIAITMEAALLESLDEWVRAGVYPNRSQAVQEAVRMMSRYRRRVRLAEACAGMDRAEAQADVDGVLPGELLPWEGE